MSTVAVGQQAPHFELTGTDGKKYGLVEALHRGPLLVAFFKVECPTCEYTFPFVERLYRQFRAQGVQIWGVSQDDARDSTHFAKEYGVTFPVLIDDYPYKVSRAYGLKYVPTLLLIAPESRVKLASEGFAEADLLEIQKSLAGHFSITPPALFHASDRVPEFKPG
jgi:peroxiredoxin